MKLRLHKHPVKQIEVIDLHEKEIPLFINKLYNVHNKPDKCMACGRTAEFVRIVIENYTKVKMLKLCKADLMRFI
ncbi:MAG: hypothetical protein AABX75_01690 [Nanoarchaeota archaeon]